MKKSLLKGAGKTIKNPYSKSKAIDKSCRNHGSCPWCQGNRQHKHRKAKPIIGE